MKTLLSLSFLILSQTSQAALLNSVFEVRHSNSIESAIESHCGSFRNLSVVDSKQEIINVDNGIKDIKFTTILTGLQRLDQNIFDTYKIIVESTYSDMYDHQSQNWGFYSVDSVSCTME